MLQLPEFQALTTLSRDGRLLFVTRMTRLFAYGFVAVVLGLYLSAIGLSDTRIGLVLSLTLVGYALLGGVLAILFTRLTPTIEIVLAKGPVTLRSLYVLNRSRGVVYKLSLLFMIDAFAGGLVVQSLVAVWFNRRFGADPAVIGTIYLGANLFAGLSALAAARVAARVGLINTLVFTDVASN